QKLKPPSGKNDKTMEKENPCLAVSLKTADQRGRSPATDGREMTWTVGCSGKEAMISGHEKWSHTRLTGCWWEAEGCTLKL
ncbi:mCG146074, partial [Mus musculus]